MRHRISDRFVRGRQRIFGHILLFKMGAAIYQQARHAQVPSQESLGLLDGAQRRSLGIKSIHDRRGDLGATEA